MNISGEERIRKTLAREPIDRVVVCPMVFENYIAKHYSGRGLSLSEATIRFYDEIGSDMIHRNCYPWLYLFVETTGPVSENWDVKIEEQSAPEQRAWSTRISTPKGSLDIQCESARVTEHEEAYAYRSLPIKSQNDLDLLLEYEPRWRLQDLNVAALQQTKKLLGDRGVTCPWAQGVFNFAGLYYRNLENLMMDPYVDEGFYRALMKHVLEQNWSYLKLLLETGADMFAYGGNMAGGELGPQFFENFVLEYEKELIRRIHSAGGRIIWHNCGKAAVLFDLYPQTGMDCFESLAQPPEGDTDLAEAKKRLGPHMTLAGGIDQKEFMVKASPSEVKDRVAAVLDIMKPGGGYLLSTVDYLAEDTPMANIKAFVESGMNYGRY